MDLCHAALIKTISYCGNVCASSSPRKDVEITAYRTHWFRVVYCTDLGANTQGRKGCICEGDIGDLPMEKSGRGLIESCE
jgi:hypothetical protein